MKIAAIDLGSNSVHMIVAEISSTGALQVLDREADMVRLGTRALSSGVLTDSAMERTLTILEAYKRVARMHRVEEIVAVATSAIREARNGEDFLKEIGRKTGIHPRAIPGEEEARLIYRAALHSVHPGGKRMVVVDIGGGSLEIVAGRGTTIDVAASLKVGVLRLTEELLRDDPISDRQEKKLVAHVREALQPIVTRIRRLGFDRVVGTSGTILTLGRIAHEASTGERPHSLHHVTVTAEALGEVRERLVALDLKRRLKIPGVDRRRGDILPAGAILLDTILERLGASEIILCEWALREGLLLDYAASRRTALARAEAYPDVRRRSVLDLAERWPLDATHARHVAKLALDLFDATRTRHGLDGTDRGLLEYAALLHDVGHHISHSRHHKHSYYLIQHADLRGFDPKEIEVMANVARYHRGGGPGKKHASFASLSRAERRKVLLLSSLLRLAEALDRGHRQRVRSVARLRGGKKLRLRCTTTGDVELETWGARRHVELLEGSLGASIELEFQPQAARAAARRRRAKTA